MNAIIRFLKAARSLKNSGITKDQVLEFAKREFGEVSAFLRKQIDNIFKSPATGAKSESKIGGLFGFKNYPKKTEKKTGEVVPFKKKEGMYRSPDEFDSRREYEKYLDEVLGPPDDVFGNPMRDQMLENFDKVKAKNVTPKGEVNPITDQMSNQQREFLGFPNRSVEAIVRAAARDVLEKAGLGPRIKGQDPIDMARQIYGEDFLEALDNISGELLDASSYPEISRILTEKKIYNFKPRKGLDIKQKGEIEDITAFDPTDRDPNAEGGLTRTSYAMGGGRDTGTIGEMKSKLGVLSNKVRRTSKRLDERGEPDFLEMGGGPVLPDKMAFDNTPRFELKDIDELINEFEMDNGRRPRSIDDLKRYFYIKYGEDFLAKIDQAITNKSKEIAMKTSDRVQAASGGLAGIINL